jgi:hypothetical protein
MDKKIEDVKTALNIIKSTIENLIYVLKTISRCLKRWADMYPERDDARYEILSNIRDLENLIHSMMIDLDKIAHIDCFVTAGNAERVKKKLNNTGIALANHTHSVDGVIDWLKANMNTYPEGNSVRNKILADIGKLKKAIDRSYSAMIDLDEVTKPDNMRKTFVSDICVSLKDLTVN